MFEGFTAERIEVNGIEINCRHGGNPNGAPMLLLHGYPQCLVEWHKLAPLLAEHFHVVATDLRGYGDSDKPPAADGDYTVYCKRQTADDQVRAMRHLGHEAFHVVGHDRGARVAHRMALDTPQAVLSYTNIDVNASQAAFEAMDADLAYSWFHWNLMRQPAPIPETLIGNSAALYLDFLLDTWTHVEGAITEDARAEYHRCFEDPACIRATCMDYRSIVLDLEHDEVDRGRRIAAPMLVLWAGEMAKRPGWQTGGSASLLETWGARAERVEGKALPCGHFIPEEMPEEAAAEIIAFVGELGR